MIRKTKPIHVINLACCALVHVAVARGAQEPCSTEFPLPAGLAAGLPEPIVDFFRAGICPSKLSGDTRPDAFHQACNVSAAWIQAMLKNDKLVKNLAERIAPVVDAIEGCDATTVDFTTDQYRVLVVQTTARIGILLIPVDGEGALNENQVMDAQEYLRVVVIDVMQHAPSIIHLGRMAQTAYGANLVFDERPRHGNGEPLSIDEMRQIAELPQPEQTEAIQKRERIRDRDLHQVDPTLPRSLVGGARNYWWGRVYAATDGNVVVLLAGKAYGGKAMSVNLEDWFRAGAQGSDHRPNATAPMPPRE